jgi:hypothetical protein
MFIVPVLQAASVCTQIPIPKLWSKDFLLVQPWLNLRIKFTSIYLK